MHSTINERGIQQQSCVGCRQTVEIESGIKNSLLASAVSLWKFFEHAQNFCHLQKHFFLFVSRH